MRLRILSDDETEALFGRPKFTHEERVEYFTLSASEKEAMKPIRFISAKINFIVQLGYFKARHMFFAFDSEDVGDDMRFIQDHYFPDIQHPEPDIANITRLKQQLMILKLANYRACNAKQQAKLAARARQAATVCSKPVYVFRELTHFLVEQRVVAPGYSTMQDIVGGALAFEQRRLAAIAQAQIDPAAKKALLGLLEDTQGLHEITLLKRDPRDFSNARKICTGMGSVRSTQNTCFTSPIPSNY